MQHCADEEMMYNRPGCLLNVREWSRKLYHMYSSDAGKVLKHHDLCVINDLFSFYLVSYSTTPLQKRTCCTPSCEEVRC